MSPKAWYTVWKVSSARQYTTWREVRMSRRRRPPRKGVGSLTKTMSASDTHGTPKERTMVTASDAVGAAVAPQPLSISKERRETCGEPRRCARARRGLNPGDREGALPAHAAHSW